MQMLNLEVGNAGAGLGAGAGALLLTALGVHPQPLFWALVGATLGMSLATQASRLRAVLVFACVVLASALLGTWVARSYFDGSLVAADGAALLLAVAFHPLLIAFTSAAPALVSGWIGRFAPGGANGSGSGNGGSGPGANDGGTKP